MKDEIPVNYKHHFLPQQTEMATWPPGRGQQGSPCPCGTTLLSGWVGGRHFPHRPTSHSFAPHSPSSQPFSKHSRAQKKGEKRREGVCVGVSLNPFMHSI